MPRLSPNVVNHAARISQRLPLLLRDCGDLDSAQNELRWMKETILKQHLHIDEQVWDVDQTQLWRSSHDLGKKLDRFVRRRARGEPLQYILGTQPFGDLEIKCRKGVLVPRPETEVYTTELSCVIKKLNVDASRPLKVADFCSGSGCIALLLHSLLKHPGGRHSHSYVDIRGFDVSEHALTLSRDNLAHNIKLKTLSNDAVSEVRFEQLDLLSLASRPKRDILERLADDENSRKAADAMFDVIVSNPPYIAPEHFKAGGPTTKSVRRFEPKLALVPPSTLSFSGVAQADQFYVALLRIAVATRSRLLVMEVGDTLQALRVAKLWRNMQGHISDFREAPPELLVEIWRDDGSSVSEIVPSSDEAKLTTKLTNQVNGDSIDSRAVVVWFDPEWVARRRAELPKFRI